MNLADATEYVVAELGKQRNRNDIIMRLCQETNSSWQQAEDFVKQIESQHHRRIAARQSPYLLIIGVVILLFGLYKVIATAIDTMNGVMYTFSYIPIPGSGNLARFGIGFAMVCGGGYGIGRTVWGMVK